MTQTLTPDTSPSAPTGPEPTIRAVYRNGASQNMARQHPLVLRVDVHLLRQNEKAIRVWQNFRASTDRIHRHFITAGDDQNRFQF